MTWKFEFNSDEPEKIEMYVYLLRAMQGMCGEREKRWADVYKDVSTEIGRSEDFVEDRMDELRGKLKNKPVKILGAEVRLKLEYSEDKIKLDTLDTTCQPIFVPFNITQVITMLVGLFYLYRKSVRFGDIAQQEANYIWAQLTEYCRNRIKELTYDMYNGFGKWLDELDEETILRFENVESDTIGTKTFDSFLWNNMKSKGVLRITCNDSKIYVVWHPTPLTNGNWKFEKYMPKIDRNKKKPEIVIVNLSEIKDIERC